MCHKFYHAAHEVNQRQGWVTISQVFIKKNFPDLCVTVDKHGTEGVEVSDLGPGSYRKKKATKAFVKQTNREQHSSDEDAAQSFQDHVTAMKRMNASELLEPAEETDDGNDDCEDSGSDAGRTDVPPPALFSSPVPPGRGRTHRSRSRSSRATSSTLAARASVPAPDARATAVASSVASSVTEADSCAKTQPKPLDAEAVRGRKKKRDGNDGADAEAVIEKVTTKLSAEQLWSNKVRARDVASSLSLLSATSHRLCGPKALATHDPEQKRIRHTELADTCLSLKDLIESRRNFFDRVRNDSRELARSMTSQHMQILKGLSHALVQQLVLHAGTAIVDDAVEDLSARFQMVNKIRNTQTETKS